MCLALVMLWSTLLFQQCCIGIEGKIQHTWANTAQLKQIQHLASFEVCSQVYNMEIKYTFHFDLFTQSTIRCFIELCVGEIKGKSVL